MLFKRVFGVVVAIQDIVDYIAGAAGKTKRDKRKHSLDQQAWVQECPPEKGGKEQHQVLQPLDRSEQL
jgi:hypothetical protein